MTLKPQRDAETSPPSVSEGLGMTDNLIVILPLQGIFLCHPELVSESHRDAGLSLVMIKSNITK